MHNSVLQYLISLSGGCTSTTQMFISERISNKEHRLQNDELTSTFIIPCSLFNIQKEAPCPYGNSGPRFFNLELVSVLSQSYRDGKFGAAFSASICCISRLL